MTRFARKLKGMWDSYKYRFVPWVALNMHKNARTLRQVTDRSEDKLLSDKDVIDFLQRLFRALLLNDPRTRCCKVNPCPPDKVMFDLLGFSIERRPSFIQAAGSGVFVSKGKVPKGATVALYPGTVYQTYEPILLQSICNPFVFRCIDGTLIDGKDKGISKLIYRSCSRRDNLGPLRLSDATWLTSDTANPLSVGQYVNNCSNYHAANVCYQELDLPEDFPVELLQYIPNVTYSLEKHRPLRCVILIALRDINNGEELLSNYYTMVH